MLEFFMNYGLFLAKTLTLVFALIMVLSILTATAAKSKAKEGQLVITNINQRLQHTEQQLKQETLPKDLYKQQRKNEQKAKKAQLKLAKTAKQPIPRLFVLRFDGDVRASQVNALRETINAILSVSMAHDEVLIVLESAGGFPTHYGLAASQMKRLKDQGLTLTVAIDRVAASGGYLMACVADHIIAAPFAIVGSIGVVAQIPNFHRLLNKNHIDFEQITAGEHKRTLTLFGKNSDKGRQKLQTEIEETHALFKEFIGLHRPQINLEQVATGEHWHAHHALRLKLVDQLQTSDAYILAHYPAKNIYELNYTIKKSLTQRLSSSAATLVGWLKGQLSTLA
jgi:serine protease SohB